MPSSQQSKRSVAAAHLCSFNALTLYVSLGVWCCSTLHPQDNGVEVMASAGGFGCNIWNPLAPTGNLIEQLSQHDAAKEVECVAISGDGSLMATGSRDGQYAEFATPHTDMIT